MITKSILKAKAFEVRAYLLERRDVTDTIDALISMINLLDEQPQKTLRDEFAMAALTGLAANPDFSEQDFEAITSAAYVAADNMLAQRMPYG